MPKINWENISISVKEFVAGLLFVFTMSGVWYKLYYESTRDKAEINAKYQELKKDYDAFKINAEARIRILEDDKTARDAVQQAAKNGDYYPMTKIKSK